MMPQNPLWLVSPLLLVIVLALTARKHRLRTRLHRQQQGLRHLQSLRQLLDLLQQHRGLTTGYLNGSVKLLGQIQALQNRTRALQRHLDGVPEVARSERWQGLIDHRTRLFERFRQLAPADNLRQHSQLLQTLLYLIDDLAQQCDLMLLRTGTGQPLVLAWRELLTAVECIGQARAVGTGAVAAGECDTVTRIRLTYLCQKIERTCGLAWDALPPSAEERTRLAALLRCIRTELVEQRQPEIDVDSYFGLASRAIAGLYDQYDDVMARRIDQREAA